MAEVFERYIQEYLKTKIKKISPEDPLYNEYQEASKLLVQNLSRLIVQKLLDDSISLKNLDNVIYEILKEKLSEELSYVPNSLEDVLSLTIALGALKLRQKRLGTELIESKNRLNEEYIERIRRTGLLINRYSPEKSKYEEVTYHYFAYLFPIVKDKETLLKVLPAVPPSVVKKIIEHKDYGWLNNNQELISIIQKYSENPCSLLDEYTQLYEPLYVLSQLLNGKIDEMVASGKRTTVNRIEVMNAIWKEIERKINENKKIMVCNYSCSNNCQLYFSWEDALRLREINNNIFFWIGLSKKCNGKIREYLDKECEERRRMYLEELKAKYDY